MFIQWLKLGDGHFLFFCFVKILNLAKLGVGALSSVGGSALYRKTRKLCPHLIHVLASTHFLPALLKDGLATVKSAMGCPHYFAVIYIQWATIFTLTIGGLERMKYVASYC